MNVLIACEESQRVCTAFREKGHNAFSCDILPCSGGHPEWHIQDDVLKYINGKSHSFDLFFMTMDGTLHEMPDRWDLIIAHPPCTYLTAAGACNIPKHPERVQLGFEAANFFCLLLTANCDKIVVENPPPMKRFCLPPYSQIVRPYMFGCSNNKPICFWLKGVDPLVPTDVVPKDENMVRWINKATGKPKSCSKWYNTNTHKHGSHCSKTFPGVAAAMAAQWG